MAEKRHDDDGDNDNYDGNVKVVSDGGGETVTSFDLGENATAYCVGRCSEDGRTYVDGIGVATLGTVASARNAVRTMWDVLSRLPRTTVVLVEEQPPINRKTCMLEAALSALAAAAYGARVIHVPTSRAVEVYGHTAGRAAKKKAAVSAVERMIEDGTVLATRESESIFSGIRRRHDVADAIVQLAWYSRIGKNERRAICSDASPWEACSRATAPRDSRRQEKRDADRWCKSERALSSLVNGPMSRKRRSGPPVRPNKKRKKR